MAKITGALLSLGGSGTIAKAVTFSKWKGQPYARQRVIPANPQTTAQTLTRNVFKDGSDIWKNAPALLVAPWNLFATGQVLTGRNAFIRDYVRFLRSEVDRADMVFSPGAKGGTAALSATPTPVSQGFTVVVTPPTPPTGWLVAGVVAAAIENVAPDAGTDFIITAATELNPATPIALSSLKALTEYSVGGWVIWTRPDGSPAYGPDLHSLATTLA